MIEHQIVTNEDRDRALPLATRPGTAPPDRPVHPKAKLSEQLLELAARFQDRPVRLLDILQTTQGRGYNLLLIILVLPFLTPIPLPLLSTPLGLAVALIGLRLAVGQKPRLPKKLLLKELPPRFFPKLLRAASRLLRLLEWFLKPRLNFMRETFVFQRVTGALIAISGLLLLLPLPIPFSNFLPGFTILLLAAGAMERDGWCLIGGWFMFAVTASAFTLLAFSGTQGLEKLWRVFNGG